MAPVLYERIDGNNVRIGTKWFKFRREVLQNSVSFFEEPRKILIPNGVLIFEDGANRFIANSFYDDINTDNL